jgi:hypothetical protein
MAGSWPSGNCPRWTMCRATCLNKLVSVMLKSMRGGHLPRGSEPGSKTDGLEAKGKKPAQTPSASRRSLGANSTPQCHKGAMGDKFSQLNRKNPYRPCHCAPGPSLRPTPLLRPHPVIARNEAIHQPSRNEMDCHGAARLAMTEGAVIAPPPRHCEERSNPSAFAQRHGLPQRCAPRNDGGGRHCAPTPSLRGTKQSIGLRTTTWVQWKSRLSTLSSPSQPLRS